MKPVGIFLALSYAGTVFSTVINRSDSSYLTERGWNEYGSWNTCGPTTWESGVEGMSAAEAQDCLDMISSDSFRDYYRGDFSVTATDLTVYTSIVVWRKTCMLTAAVPHGRALNIGIDDISDLVGDAVRRASKDGLVISNGVMSCSGDSGDGQMNWSLARYNGP